MKQAFIVSLLSVVLCGCYRLPSADEYTVIPNTNNPDVTRECTNAGVAPGMNL